MDPKSTVVFIRIYHLGQIQVKKNRVVQTDYLNVEDFKPVMLFNNMQQRVPDWSIATLTIN